MQTLSTGEERKERNFLSIARLSFLSSPVTKVCTQAIFWEFERKSLDNDFDMSTMNTHLRKSITRLMTMSSLYPCGKLRWPTTAKAKSIVHGKISVSTASQQINFHGIIQFFRKQNYGGPQLPRQNQLFTAPNQF